MWSDSTHFDEYLFCCSQKNVYFSVKGFHSDLSIDDRSLINLGPHLHIWKQCDVISNVGWNGWANFWWVENQRLGARIRGGVWGSWSCHKWKKCGERQELRWERHHSGSWWNQHCWTRVRRRCQNSILFSDHWTLDLLQEWYWSVYPLQRWGRKCTNYKFNCNWCWTSPTCCKFDS